MKTKGLKLVLTGGGTGGHVYPSLAIYNVLKENFEISDVIYIGCKGKAEEKIVPKQNIPIKFISSSPISGVSKKSLPLAFFKIFKGFLSSIFILLKFKPNIVLASGGYVSAPVILGAFFLKPILKCKIILDEQNVFPGLLNRFGSLFADLVFLSFKESVKFIWNNRCIYSGYPVRGDFLKDFNVYEVRKGLNLPKEKFIVLISGGSMGARNINRVVAKSVPELMRFKDLLIIHSCGLSEYPYNGFEDVKSILAKEGFSPEVFEENGIKRGVLKRENGEIFYIFTNFIYQMSDYMKASNLVVGRAGAGSITEICALGKPSILIPKRDLPGFHQELNGIALAEKGGCEVIFEKRDEDGNSFVEKFDFISTISKLIEDRKGLDEMGEVAKGEFNKNFKEILTESIDHLLKKGELNFINPLTVSSGISFEGEIEKIISFLKRQNKGSIYIKFFNTKVDEYLKSDSWQVFNKGVKLSGALKRADKIDVLLEKFNNSNGFVRRNILKAIIEIGEFFSKEMEVVDLSLMDSYYEVRREGVRFLRIFHSEIVDKEKYLNRMLSLLDKSFQHFEVKCEVLRTLPFYIDEENYYKIIEKYITKENVSYREAVLDGILNGFRGGGFKDRDRVYNLALKMLITTSYFKPKYSIRDKYYKLYTFLEKLD